MIASTDSAAAQAEGQPRLGHRLSVRLAGLFAAVTLLAVGAVGLFTYERHQREVQDTVGTQLLNIARVAALLVDPALHAEVQQTLAPTSDAYRQLQKRLVAVQNEVLPEPHARGDPSGPAPRGRAHPARAAGKPRRVRAAPLDQAGRGASPQVDVVKHVPGQGEVTLRRLHAGECFGEIALLGDHVRTATARSVSAVNLLAVDRDAFRALFSTLPPLRHFFERLIEERTMLRPAAGDGPAGERPAAPPSLG